MVYHCTTPKKLARYRTTGYILPPVRYFTVEYAARRWMRRTGRTVLVTFDEPSRSWPLPDHGPAKWTDQPVAAFVAINEGE